MTPTTDVYNFQPLTSVSTTLEGNRPWINIETKRDGKAPISGTFRLQFRNDSTSALNFDAESSAMKTALETLDSIGEVDVSRSSVNAVGGYTWTVTFKSVNVKSSYGLIQDSMGNLQPLEAVTTTSGGRHENLNIYEYI